MASRKLNKPAMGVDPVVGVLNDFADFFGMHRPVGELVPSPNDVLTGIGLPPVREMLPSPKEIGDNLFKNQPLKGLSGISELPKRITKALPLMK